MILKYLFVSLLGLCALVLTSDTRYWLGGVLEGIVNIARSVYSLAIWDIQSGYSGYSWVATRKKEDAI